MIKVTSIAKDNIQFFSDYMSSQAVAMIEGGMPILALGALDDETACGALTGFVETRGTFRINGLYMAPSSRRRGGAAMLLRVMGELLSEFENIESVKIDYVEFGEDERNLSGLLEVAGFEQKTPETHFFATELTELSKCRFFKTGDAHAVDAIPFSEMSDYLMRSVDKRFAVDGMPGMKMQLGSDLERELSTGIVEGTSVPAFVLVVSQKPRLHVALLFSQPEYSSKLPALLRGALQRAIEKYPGETLVTMQTVNEKGEAIARRIMTDCNYKNLARSAEFVLRPVEALSL